MFQTKPLNCFNIRGNFPFHLILLPCSVKFYLQISNNGIPSDQKDQSHVHPNLTPFSSSQVWCEENPRFPYCHTDWVRGCRKFWGVKNGTSVLYIHLGPVKLHRKNTQTTLPETNIAPENGWLEDVFPIETVPFQVLC